MNLIKKRPAKMTPSELIDAISDLVRRRKEINTQLAELQSIYDSKMATEKVSAELAGMTPEQKRAILQQIEADGISSSEEFGQV